MCNKMREGIVTVRVKSCVKEEDRWESSFPRSEVEVMAGCFT